MKNMRSIVTSILILVLVILLSACSFDFSNTCIHSFSDWETTATCTEYGISYRVCTKCNLREEEVVEAFGHDIHEVDAKAATCSEAGYNAHTECSRCGLSLDKEEYAKLEHDKVSVSAKTPTCTESGWEAYEKCNNCDYSTKVELPIDEDNHDLQVVAGKPATCTQSGYAEYQACTRCDYSTKVDIQATGHTFVSGQCSVCGAYTTSAYSSSKGRDYLATRSDSTKLLTFYDRMEAAEADFYASNSTLSETHVSGDTTYYISLKLEYQDIGLSTDQVKLVWKEFMADHPLYFWMAKVISIQNTKVFMLVEEEFKNGATRSALISSIMDGISTIINPISEKSLSAYEKALYFHDTIISYINYSYLSDGVTPNDSAWAHSIVGVLTKQGAVCEGYAKTFQLLLNATGVDNYYVTGTGSGTPHAWNLVKLDDGKWYWCDLTWDDSPTWEFGCTYTYFMVTDSESLNSLDGGYTSTSGTFTLKHSAYTSASDEYLYPLPTRGTTPYAGTDSVRSTFTKDGLEYAIVAYAQVALVNINTASTDVVVPEKVTYEGKTYTVSMIGGLEEKLFTVTGMKNSTTAVTSISIPKTVVFIWDEALNFKTLKSIIVSSDNPNFMSSDGVLFTKGQGTLIKYPSSKEGTSYVVPNVTKTVAVGAFSYCSNLTSLTYGSGVVLIGKYAGPYGYMEDMSLSEEERIRSYEIALTRNQMKSGGANVIQFASGNTAFVEDEGVIYSKDKTVVYSVIYSATSVTLPFTVQRIETYAVLNVKNITTINYAGTKAMWNAIEFGPSWENYNDKLSTVTCIDGKIIIK